MKVTKYDIQNVIDTLENLLEEMEVNDVEEVKTSCNTYRLYNFISFGSKGYLDLDNVELEIDED